MSINTFFQKMIFNFIQKSFQTSNFKEKKNSHLKKKAKWSPFCLIHPLFVRFPRLMQISVSQIHLIDAKPNKVIELINIYN